MKKFNEYKSARDLYEFDKKFDGLCESIYKSGLTFEQYWKNFALPILIESNSFENENQLLNEISEGIFDRVSNGMHNLFYGNKSPKKQVQPPDLTNPANTTAAASNPNFNTGSVNTANSPYPNYNTGSVNAASSPNSNFDNRSINTEDPAIQDPNMTPERQKKLAAFQQKADQQINQIKSDFKVAMRSFLKQASDQAKDQGDHHMWQIAQVFYKKIMDTSSPIIDGFKLKAKFGKPAYKEPFTKERDAMQMNRTNTLKSNLQSNKPNLLRSAQERKNAAIQQAFQQSPDFPGNSSVK